MSNAILPRDYYVYLHRRATTGEIFYCGKGCDRRAWVKDGRSTYWHNIANKHGYTVEIVQDGLQEFAAFELECDLIALYGRKDCGLGPLINGTDGGDGASGVVVSEERRIFMSGVLMDKGHPIHSENARQKSKEVILKKREESPELWIKVPVIVHGKRIGLKEAGKILGTSDSNIRKFAKNRNLSIQAACDWHASRSREERLNERLPRGGFILFEGGQFTKKQLCEKYKVSFFTVYDMAKREGISWVDAFQQRVFSLNKTSFAS